MRLSRRLLAAAILCAAAAACGAPASTPGPSPAARARSGDLVGDSAPDRSGLLLDPSRPRPVRSLTRPSARPRPRWRTRSWPATRPSRPQPCGRVRVQGSRRRDLHGLRIGRGPRGSPVRDRRLRISRSCHRRNTGTPSKRTDEVDRSVVHRRRRDGEAACPGRARADRMTRPDVLYVAWTAAMRTEAATGALVGLYEFTFRDDRWLVGTSIWIRSPHGRPPRRAGPDVGCGVTRWRAG